MLELTKGARVLHTNELQPQYTEQDARQLAGTCAVLENLTGYQALVWLAAFSIADDSQRQYVFQWAMDHVAYVRLWGPADAVRMALRELKY